MIKEVMPSKLLDTVLEYVDYVNKVLKDFQESIRLLNSLRIGEARSKLTDAMKKDKEVYRIKETAIEILEKTHVHPALKEDFYHFIKTIYRVCDWVKEASRELIVLPYIEIPDEIRGKLERLTTKLIEAFETLSQAIHKAIRGEYGESIKLVEKVLKIEEEADEIDLSIRDSLLKLHASYETPVLAILIHELNKDLEGAVDSCRDAADYLRALIVGWIVT